MEFSRVIHKKGGTGLRCFLPGLRFPPSVSLTVKRILFVVALSILPAAGYVLVAQSTGEASPCSLAPLADYLSLQGGCDIGGETFSNFSFVTGSVNAGDVKVTPVTTAGKPGFKFDGSWTPSTGNSTLFFDLSSTPLINGVSLAADFSCPNCTPQSAITGATMSFGSFVIGANTKGDPSSATFSPVAFLNVDGGLDFDANSGSLRSVTVQFSEVPTSVPEPSIILLLGTGVLGLVFRSGILQRRL